MRFLFFALCLVLAALLVSGCSKPWENSSIPDSKQAEYQFDKDSTDCGILASEKYPLSKDKQLPLYEGCMEDKGWVKHQQGDGIPWSK